MQLDDFIVHKHDDSEPGEEDINSVYAALNENNFETIILPTEKTRSTVVTAKNNKINQPPPCDGQKAENWHRNYYSDPPGRKKHTP